jgi:signal transduction histidine kinase
MQSGEGGCRVSFERARKARASGEQKPAGEEELIRTAKLGSLATLAAGMAHEINNPNNFILLNSRMLAKVWQSALPVLDGHAASDPGFTLAGIPYAEARAKVGDLIRGVTEGALRIEKIIQGLGDYTRQTLVTEEKEIGINTVVEGALPVVDHLIRSATDRFSVTCAEGLPPVRGNHHQLEQVVINLLINSCQAVNDRSRGITVRTRSADGAVVLEVADEGSGITEGDLKRLFQPFFTTKRAAGGTGLGLPICRAIVSNHGGSITVRSCPGEGTTVTVSLPAAVSFPA